MDGQESEIIIARRGRPAAKLLPVDTSSSGQRIGIAAVKFSVPEDIDVDNREIGRKFNGNGAWNLLLDTHVALPCEGRSNAPANPCH